MEVLAEDINQKILQAFPQPPIPVWAKNLRITLKRPNQDKTRYKEIFIFSRENIPIEKRKIFDSLSEQEPDLLDLPSSTCTRNLLKFY